MEWVTNFLHRIFDQEEKLSPAEAEEAERKIRTQERAEIKRLEDERRQNIRDKAEKFRLPGGRGSFSYNSNGELKYSNDKIKNFVEKDKRKETPEERKARLKKLAKERVKTLLNTPQSFGQNQGDTSRQNQAENNGWLDNIPFRDTIYTGPRGGRYRVTDKGRKIYDVE